MLRIIRLAIFTLLVTCVAVGSAFGKTVPPEDTNAPYFYVFGPDGDPLLGAEDNTIEIYIEVPVGQNRDVTIGLYDPDTSRMRDFRTDSANAWDTLTEFKLYGKALLAEKSFGEDDWDRRYYDLGPFPPSAGEQVGDVYRFRLVATAVSGDDANLFRVRIRPKNAQAESRGRAVPWRLPP